MQPKNRNTDTKLSLAEPLRTQRSKILSIAKKYGAHNVRIFGSYARGEAGRRSDIDLLVNFDSDRSLLDHVGLTQELEDILSRRVDVVSEAALHWFIRDRVLSEAVPLRRTFDSI